MDKAIDLHNRELRAIMDEFAGHEIRNEGDRCGACYFETTCESCQLMTAPMPPEGSLSVSIYVTT